MNIPTGPATADRPVARRVAQVSFSTKHAVGAPSFAHFAKGGTED